MKTRLGGQADSNLGARVVLPDIRVRVPEDFAPLSEAILKTTILPVFEGIVERHSGHVAIKRGSRLLSYRQLNNGANSLANQIIHDGDADRSPVAVLLDDEVACIVAALAAVKSGRPYVMLYPGNSSDLPRFLADSKAGVLVTSSDRRGALGSEPSGGPAPKILLLDELDTDHQVSNPGIRLRPDDLFAIYYTSGSTGQPKGVVERHLARSYRAYANVNAIRLAPSDRVGLVLSIWHAGALSNLMAGLLSGATLYPLDLRTGASQDTFRWLQQERITALWCTPTILRSIFQSAPDGLVLPDLRFMQLGGETISTEDIELVQAHTAEDFLVNLSYATSEASAVSEYGVYHDTPRFEGPVPAGRPLPGVEVMLLGDDGKRVPRGAVGEICVSSPYLSLGYWNNPELTARVFAPHPTDAARRICHTGDVGRWRDDGLLDIVGRRDTQVKIRGFRVQLEAVDVALRNVPGVAEAATIIDHPAGRSTRLVAYVAMESGERFSVSRLRRNLSFALPSYSIPSLFIQMESLPRTGLGKIARNALPPPSTRRPEIDTEFVGARNDTEAKITSIWEKVLGIQGIGVQDSFFELGGDSLSAVEMTLDVERQLNAGVPQAFFNRPTIRELAASLAAKPERTAQSRDSFASSHRLAESPPEGRKLRRRVRITPRKLLTRSYSSRDVDRLIDLIVLRHMAGKNYVDAIRWAIDWSRRPIVLGLLYARRRDLYSRWLRSMPRPSPDAIDLFGRNVFANILPRRRVRTNASGDDAEVEKIPRVMRRPFWRSLANLLNSTPPGALPDFLEVGGQQHLVRAYDRGMGVILVSLHGLPGPGQLSPIEKFLGLGRITTISYRMPRRQSRYWNQGDNIPGDVADAMNTELALYSARQLQEGRIIQVLNDSPDRQGRAYGAAIAGRMHHLKAGFAELALNTGAAIVPHWRYCLPDGRLRFEFGPELGIDAGDRDQQVEGLVQTYASFMEETWSRHPESVRWGRMRKHLSRPSSRLPA